MATADETGDLASVMRRVRKLMALANDGRGDVNEMAAAAEMAAKIMAKYRLDYADVLAAELKAGAKFDTSIHGTPKYGRAARRAKAWFGILGIAVARLNECCFENLPEGVTQFYGVESDVLVAGYMQDYLSDQIHRAASAYYALTKNTRGADEFAFGMAQEIVSKLKAIKPEITSTGTALVVTKARVVEEHFGRYMTTVRVRGPRSEAGEWGKQAGARIDVGRRGMGSAVGGQNLLK